MSGRTQFWLGSVMLALAMGLLVGSVVCPRVVYSQEGFGEGRTSRYALVTGIRGSTPNTETLYIVDDVNEILMILEYNSRSEKLEPTQYTDLRRFASKIIEERAKRDRGK